MCVTWLIRMCKMTHLLGGVTRSYAWHESFICVTWFIHMWHNSSRATAFRCSLRTICTRARVRARWRARARARARAAARAGEILCMRVWVRGRKEKDKRERERGRKKDRKIRRKTERQSKRSGWQNRMLHFLASQRDCVVSCAEPTGKQARFYCRHRIWHTDKRRQTKQAKPSACKHKSEDLKVSDCSLVWAVQKSDSFLGASAHTICDYCHQMTSSFDF